jgi:carboxyl-terminal processing protease
MTLPRASFVRPLLVASLAASCLAGGYSLGLRDGASGSPLLPPTAQMSASDRRAFGVVWETLSTLERDYYRPEQLDPARLAAGAASGMVAAVGDPYTTLSDPQQAEQTAARLHGSFDGVGIELDRRQGQLLVVAPLAGSPAEQAGVRSGDVIVDVDGQDLTQLEVERAASLIRGPRDTQVSLGLLRDGSRMDFALVRQPIKVQSVHSRMLGGDTPLAYARISIFSEPTGAQLREQLGPLLAQGARGVVLDLRGNPGGYLNSAVDVVSAFLKDGVVLYQARDAADPARRAYRTSGNPQAPDLPIVVLVDHGSASAAEIVAAALRDSQRGVLIGARTFGKGTAQELHTLSDSSQLRLTVSQWLTPAGHAIQGEGLQPDIEVQAVDGSDAPLDAAVRYLAQGALRG